MRRIGLLTSTVLLPVLLLVPLLAGCHDRAAKPAQPPAPKAPGPPAASTDAAAAPSSVDAPAARARWKPDAIAPVVTLGDRSFVALTGWLEPDATPDVAWAGGPFTQLGGAHHSISMQAATGAPALWKSAIGAAVTGYRYEGTRCPTTITGLYWLGRDHMPDSLGDDPVFVGELAPTPGCLPIVVTDRNEPVFGIATKPAPKQVAAVTKAFAKLPQVRAAARGRDDDKATVSLFMFGADARIVVAQVFVKRDAACDPEPLVVRATFALDPGAAPRLLTTTTLEASPVTRAMLDSNHDGVLELVFDEASFDHGMSTHELLATYFDPAAAGADDAARASSIAWSLYAGCD